MAGEGGDAGPDLSVVGSALPASQIIESILWPNRLVKEGFAATRIVTTEGQIFTGYKLKETADEVQLRDITTREVRRIPREDIEDMTNVGSVMPAGLTIGMTDAEFRDMIRYLSELGRGGAAETTLFGPRRASKWGIAFRPTRNPRQNGSGRLGSG